MSPLSDPITNVIGTWSAPARARFDDVRRRCHEVAQAAEIGPLDESLKWGQPAWRPRRPRTGTTLRAWWSLDRPERLDLYVDCKTTLAADVDDAFPGAFDTDRRRVLSLGLDRPVPDDALWHLIFRTFTYHRAKAAR